MIEEDNFDKKLGRQAKINRDKQYNKKDKNDHIPRPKRDPYKRERANYEDFIDEDILWEE